MVLASHPELCILHVEVRTRRRGEARALGYEAVPLAALASGRRVLALRDPRTGARLHFATLVVKVDREKIATPARLFTAAASALPQPPQSDPIAAKVRARSMSLPGVAGGPQEVEEAAPTSAGVVVAVRAARRYSMPSLRTPRMLTPRVKSSLKKSREGESRWGAPEASSCELNAHL